MRWSSLLSTLALTAASIAAPRLLFHSIGLDAQGVAAIQGTLKGISSGEALDARVMQDARALRDGRTEGLSLERLAAVQGALGSSEGRPPADLGAALAGALAKQRPLQEDFRSGVLRDAETVRVVYRQARSRVLAGLLALGAASLVAALLGAVPAARPLARFFLTLVFGLASRWLMLLSLGTAAFFWVAGVNPWPLLPGEATVAPAGFMLLCGLFVRALDPNYPLWNGFLRGFGAPILASAAIAGGVLMDPGSPQK